MQLTSLSSIAQGPPLLPQSMVSGTTQPSPRTAPARAASNAPTQTAAPAPTAPAPPETPAVSQPAAPSRTSHADAAAATSAAIAELTVTGYSTTVGGKQYAGSVEDANGTYTASIPSVNGATASGSSLVAAENNLDVRIDELV